MTGTLGTTLTVLDETTVADLIDMPTAIDVVEGAFRADGHGRTLNYPVVREAIERASGTFGIKSGYMPSEGWLGLKAGGYWTRNHTDKQLSNHQSTIVLFDPESGVPRCVINANRLTALRTGAAGAVAARHLAPATTRSVLLLGAGEQASSQLEALRCVLELEQVFVWSRSRDSADRFIARVNETGLNAEFASDTRTAAREVELIVTTTPAQQPILDRSHTHPGLHINAMGSDTVGKRELDPSILSTARVVVDDRAQSQRLGETQGLENAASYISSTLGEIAAGLSPGRQPSDMITVFDSTGVTFQDLAVAGYVYKTATERNLGRVVNF